MQATSRTIMFYGAGKFFIRGTYGAANFLDRRFIRGGQLFFDRKINFSGPVLPQLLVTPLFNYDLISLCETSLNSYKKCIDFPSFLPDSTWILSLNFYKRFWKHLCLLQDIAIWGQNAFFFDRRAIPLFHILLGSGQYLWEYGAGIIYFSVDKKLSAPYKMSVQKVGCPVWKSCPPRKRLWSEKSPALYTSWKFWADKGTEFYNKEVC